MWRFKRRPLIIVPSVCMVLVICAAVGGAVGAFYANKSALSSIPIATPTADLDDAGDPQTHTDEGETGTTGIAHPLCTATTVLPPLASQATPRNMANPYDSPTGHRSSFDSTCRRGMLSGGGLDHHAIVYLRHIQFHHMHGSLLRSEGLYMDRCSVWCRFDSDAAAGDLGGSCLLERRISPWTRSQPEPPRKLVRRDSDRISVHFFSCCFEATLMNPGHGILVLQKTCCRG